MHKLNFYVFLIYFFFLIKVSHSQVTTPFSSLNSIGEISDNSYEFEPIDLPYDNIDFDFNTI